MTQPTTHPYVNTTGTFEDLTCLPEAMRTRPSYKDEGGSYTDITPLTVLRRHYLGIVAEIVRISYWIESKEDGTTLYQVNLCHLHPFAFDKNQPAVVSIESYVNPEFSEFESLLVLLKDVHTFIARQRSKDQEAGLHI